MVSRSRHFIFVCLTAFLVSVLLVLRYNSATKLQRITNEPILIDEVILNCLTCPVNSTRPIHFAAVSDRSLAVENTVIHQIIDDPDKDYIVILFEDERRALRRFETKDHFLYGRLVQIPADPEQFLWEWKRGRLLECRNMTIERASDTKRIISLDFVDDLAEFRDLVMEFRVTPLMFGGTLLGWFRECSIIPHTWDIDFAVLREEHSEALLDHLVKSTKFRTFWFIGKIDDCFELSVYRRGVKIDLFYLYSNRATNESTLCGTLIPKKQKWIYSHPHFPDYGICAGDLLGKMMYTPCSPKVFIEAEYGSHWERDRIHERWTELTENVTITTESWPEETFDEVVRTVNKFAEIMSLRETWNVFTYLYSFE